jgi:hypothetical protein
MTPATETASVRGMNMAIRPVWHTNLAKVNQSEHDLHAMFLVASL